MCAGSRAVAVPMVGLLILAGLTLSIIQVETPVALLFHRLWACASSPNWQQWSSLLALGRPQPAVPDAQARSGGVPVQADTRSAPSPARSCWQLVILGLVATWRFTPPPRALVAAAAEPVSVHMHTAPDDGRADASALVMRGPVQDLDVADDRGLRAARSQGGNAHAGQSRSRDRTHRTEGPTQR